MINKQSLWFLTLFSLILVLSVYYITMPNELLLTNNSKHDYANTEQTSEEVENGITTTISESELLVAMRVNLEEERSEQIADLRSTLTNEQATSDEKNSAYEKIKYITNLKAREEKLEQKIKKEFDLECFIKISDTEVNVVAIKENHDVTLANKIMKAIQSEFDNKIYITIKFEK